LQLESEKEGHMPNLFSLKLLICRKFVTKLRIQNYIILSFLFVFVDLA